MGKKVSVLFVGLGLSALIVGALIGVLISIVYVSPDFLKDVLPFNRLRPMHTTTAVSWIILTATGGIYYYLAYIEKIQLFSRRLAGFHLILFILTGIGIYYSLLFGKMGGREYLEYFPLLTVPILIGWLVFGINYFASLYKKVKQWPVYFWMWGVGIVFMIYHLSEAHFWIFTDIRTDYIKDLSIQWKSYGSFVGSWNMLVYGTAIYLMSKIKGDDSVGRGKVAFFFFFLGLTNLMFGWAHHTYIIPTQPWIRILAYAISMTEWIIFINIVYNWAKSLSLEKKKIHLMAYRFLMASEFWVFLNIILALLMSIPTLNYYTHGTHVTVAHSMGTTIGINTTILLASVSFMVSKLTQRKQLQGHFTTTVGFYIFNISLFIFWVSLITGGIYKAIYMSDNPNPVYSEFHDSASPVFWIFITFGIGVFVGLVLIVLPLLKQLSKQLFSK